MSRLSFLRLTSGLALIGGVLQIIGGFLPFTIVMDGLQRVTENSDTLWVSLVHTITEIHATDGRVGGDIVQTSSFYYTQVFFICLFFLAILIPLLTALAGMFNRWRQSLLILGLVFALSGVLEISLLALLELLLNGWCGPEAMSAADCTLVRPGTGLALTVAGFLLSLGCFVAANVLSLKAGEKRSRFAAR